MLKRKVKNYILEAHAAARAAKAWLKTRSLADGDYTLPYRVYHSTLQPTLSITFRDEVDQFGEVEALRWSRDACGIAAAKSAITTLCRLSDPGFELPSISALARDQVAQKGYVEKIGWAHLALAKLARKYGLSAANYVNERPIALCDRLLAEEIPIVSVTLYFRGGIPVGKDADSNLRSKGGHLVVLRGFRWKSRHCVGFYVDDSQNTTLKEGEDSEEFVEIPAFEASYSGKVIYIRNP